MIDRILRVIPPQEVATAIEAERECRSYRPTAVLFAHTAGTAERAEFVFGRLSKYPRSLLWPLQGGVEDNETVQVAASRELHEEIPRLCVPPDRIDVLGAMRYAIPRAGRDGYDRGKLLIACRVPVPFLHVDDIPTPNSEEVSELKGYTPRAARKELFFNVAAEPRTAKKALFADHFIHAITTSRLS